MERLRIVGDGTRAGTKVFLNGLEVRDVQHVGISVGVAEKPTATLIIRGVDLDLDGRFETAVHEDRLEKPEYERLPSGS